MRSLAVFVTAVLVLATAVAAGTPVLKRVFLLHRHGAREPLGVLNGTTLFCRHPNCEITNEGKQMLLTLGNEFASKYKGVLGIPDPYNVSFIMSNATDYPRVTISAEAFIMGLFDGQDPLPFVDFMPKLQDLELVMWESWPTWKLRNTYAKELHVDDDWVRGYIGSANVTRIGDYFGIPTMCANTPSDCVNYAQDVVACNISAGLTPPQWLLDMWPRMKVVVARFLSRTLGFDPAKSDYHASIGSYGYPLATSALQFLSQRTTAGSHADLMRLYHIGAHDWTLFALFTALGTWTPATRDEEQWVVQFGEAVILEVWEDSVSGERTVNAIRAIPEQSPGLHPYTYAPMTVQCVAADGTRYNGSSCPIDDLWRFVNTTAPQDPAGVCFVTDDILQEQNCDTNDAPPAGSRCLFYRQNCPGQPCGSVPGGIVDPARGYMCQTAQLGKGTPFVIATMIAIMAPSLLAGAIAGFYGASHVKRVLWSGKNDGETMPLTK